MYNNMSKSNFSDGFSSAFSQLLLLTILIILLSSVGGGVIQFAGSLYGLDYSEAVNSISKNSSYVKKDFIRCGVIIGQLFTFTIPAIIFSWILFKRNSISKLLLDKAPTLSAIGWMLVLVVLAFPLVQWLFWLNKQVPLPDWAIEQEVLVNNTIFSLLSINHPHELFLNIIGIGLLPAIGEELVFRGLIQRQLERTCKNATIAIIGSAFLFSFIHLQFQGFLPRFFLGVLLGFLFFWTKSLWMPVLAHFFYNTSQVIIQHFYYTQQQRIINLEKLEQLPVHITLFAFIVFLFGLWFFPKSNRSVK